MSELVLKDVDGIGDFELTQEEAKFAIDFIKQKRDGNTHFAKVTKLKDTNWFKKTDRRDYLNACSQHISNLQISMDGINYHVDNVMGRGCISEVNSGKNPKVFDIASTKKHDVLGSDIKACFMAIIREKVFNDINSYNMLIDKMVEDGVIGTSIGIKIDYLDLSERNYDKSEYVVNQF